MKLVESLDRIPCGPAFVCDLGPLDASAGERWDLAWDLAAPAIAEVAGGEGLFRTLCAGPPSRSGRQTVSTLWLGACYTSSVESRLRLYFDVGAHTAVASWRRTVAALAGAGYGLREGAGSVFGFLATHGHRQGFTVEISTAGRSSAEVYFQPRRVDEAQLRTLAKLAGIPGEVVTGYVHRMLRGSEGWGDARARIGVSVDPEGEICELTLYVDPRRYYRCDDELRRRILAFAPGCGWDVSHYRSTSRLIDADSSAPVRTLLGFGVSSGGHARLSVEARTGHLALSGGGARPC